MILNILDYYLYPNHLLSILQLIEIQPHSKAQPLHYDYNHYMEYLDHVSLHQQLHFWALMIMRCENYVTIIYPGSYLWSRDRMPTQKTVVSYTLNRGDAICVLEQHGMVVDNIWDIMIISD